MKNNKITIGQMAKLNHTTLATLRLYDEKGLLKPIEVNPKSNYRIYDVRQSMVFHMIQHNKDLGLSLKEIAAILDHSSADFLVHTYSQKVVELDRKMRELQWQKRELQKVLRWNDYFTHRPPKDTLTIGYVPSSHVYMKKAVRNYFQEDFGSVVYDLSCMEGELHKKKIRGVYPYNAFLTVKQEDFLAGRCRADRIGMIVPDDSTEKVKTETYESSTCACVYFEDFEQAPAYMEKLLAYCQQENCTLIGDVTCQIIGVLEAQDFRKTAETLRFQVPIQRDDSSAPSAESISG
ncbi:MerR family transcriptional regulator [Mitsuokella jalaludinii]|uniref:MerR family transcriptional regulator n=1 Tax=Mitsuokella jalaludinii TaxID=187979 RepID=UPI0039F49803